MKHLILLMGVLLVLPLVSDAKVGGSATTVDDWDTCPGEKELQSPEKPTISAGEAACYNTDATGGAQDSAVFNATVVFDLEFDSDVLTDGIDTARIYLMRCIGDNDTAGAMTKADAECGRVFHVTTPMDGDDGSTTAQLRFLYDIPPGWYYIDQPTGPAGAEISRVKIRGQTQ